jgi:hypothetical protein
MFSHAVAFVHFELLGDSLFAASVTERCESQVWIELNQISLMLTKFIQKKMLIFRTPSRYFLSIWYHIC